MNRTLPNNQVTVQTVGPVIGTGLRETVGPAAFAQQAGASATSQATNVAVAINPDAWSLFMPVTGVSLASTNSNSNYNRGIPGTSGTASAVAGQVWPNLCIHAERTLFGIGNGWRAGVTDMAAVPKRVTAVHDFTTGKALLMATFPTVHGI